VFFRVAKVDKKKQLTMFFLSLFYLKKDKEAKKNILNTKKHI